MRDLDALILDVGNTLYYLDVAAVAAILERYGIGPLPLELARRAEARARPRLSDYLATGASTEARDSFRRYLELALDEARIRVERARADAAFDDVCAAHRKRNAFAIPAPGALETLAELRAAGVTLGVVSNSNGRVRDKLDEGGFTPLLATIVDSGVVGIEKPDPRIFELACAQLGVAPGRALYVGDLYAIDVVGARAAGLRAALVDPESAYRERDVDVECVRDVPELVARIMSDAPDARLPRPPLP